MQASELPSVGEVNAAPHMNYLLCIRVAPKSQHMIEQANCLLAAYKQVGSVHTKNFTEDGLDRDKAVERVCSVFVLLIQNDVPVLGSTIQNG
jgi:hypothetical protein